jgi:hypothetical protein
VRGISIPALDSFALGKIMNKSYWLILILLLSMCLSLSCGFQTSADCSQLCSLPYEQKDKTFLSQPIEGQIDLYLECTCKEDSITSDYRFSSYIAKNGNRSIPVLVGRLKSEEDEERQLKIISVLSQMSLEDLRGRKDVVDLVNQKVANMKGGFLARLNGDDRDKKYARELAEKIELNSQELDRR